MTTTAAIGPGYSSLIVEALTRYPAREAFVLGDRRVTYAETADTTARIQRVMHDHRVRRGSGVGVLSPNAPEVFMTQAAAFLSGARYSGLHPMGSVSDHVFLCDDAEIELLVVHPKFAEAAAAVAERAASVRHVLAIGPDSGFPDLLELAGRIAPSPLRALAVDEEEVGWLQYTGGTTGRPKGAMLSHRALVQEVQSLTAGWGLPENPRYLAASPITHAAVLPLLPTLLRGGTVLLQQGFDPDAWLRAVETEKVNYTFLVPTMLYTLLDKTDPTAVDTSSLESLVYGAAPMSAARIEEAQEAFGPVLLQVYGQTECMGMTTSLRKDEHDPARRPELLASCGRPVPGVEVQLLDDAGSPVADGQIGEIAVRSRNVMNGYWKRPDETAAALRGGWLHTGDMARKSDDGFIYIVDRKKDMIVTGGFNVFAKEVEDAIAAHANVSAVAVIGVPDEKWGEAITAFVVARPDATIDADQLIASVRARKGPHQAPKRLEIVTELPMTAVGKIDKKALRARHWADRSRQIN
ncbi:AMP-binding protein [Mycobacterium sp. E3247]|uniref:AMP-binding protein n=1 Tax=Mycobacterium sp. E3247 TaxID=1856864 RepID=UPI0007FF496E|nr:AMP-binding protein [Mycobacterium sp. E3247]OBH01556.1 acyl-CoA synthetase [Mycobacterium sp. E3247]